MRVDASNGESMKTQLLALVLATLSVGAFAKDATCSSIKNDKLRLACYDKVDASIAKSETIVSPPPTPTPTPPAQKPLKPGEAFKSGNWIVNQKLDAMTDKKTCTALYRGEWAVQGTVDSFYIGLSGRGGVRAYKLRLDDAPPDDLRLASDLEKKISAADLSYSFGRIYDAKRVRVQITTILNTVVVEDVDMSGFKEAVDFMKSNCEA